MPSETSGTRGASHSHSSPSSTPRRATGDRDQRGLAAAPGSAPGSVLRTVRPGGGRGRRPSAELPRVVRGGSCGGGGGVSGAVTPPSCQARPCADASPDGAPGGTPRWRRPARPRRRPRTPPRSTSDRRPVGVRRRRSGRTPPRRRSRAAGPGRSRSAAGSRSAGSTPEQQRRRHAQLAEQRGQLLAGARAARGPRRARPARRRPAGSPRASTHRCAIGSRKSTQPTTAVTSVPGHGEGGVRARPRPAPRRRAAPAASRSGRARRRPAAARSTGRAG